MNDEIVLNFIQGKASIKGDLTLHRESGVEVFKTNVEDRKTASDLIEKLLRIHPLSKINFDLEDCDRILRVSGTDIQPDKIIGELVKSGFSCEVLLD